MTTTIQTMLLTGCASGIGRYLAGRLAILGHNLLLTDINNDALQTLALERGWSPDRIQTRQLDVRDPAAWQKAVAAAVTQWGKLDVVINVAGFLTPGYAHTFAIEDVDKHIDINTKGVIYGTHYASRQMVSQGSGHIVNIGSLASLAPVGGLNLYVTSKFAVRGFSLTSALELRKHGVAVTVVMPDAVETPMLTLQESYEEAALTFSGGRTLTVQDVADVIINDVLENRPIEITIPRGRGLTARLVNTFPTLGIRLDPILRRIGRRNQKKRLR